MEPLKVGFIVSALVNKGVIFYVRDLVNELIIKGCDCQVFYFDEEIEIKFSCYSERISIYHKIDFNYFDIIHSHGLRPNLYVFLHRKKTDSTKYITTIHSYIEPDLAYTYNRLISFVFSRIWNFLLIKQDLVVCLTEDAQNYYRKILLSKNITFVHTGRNLSDNKEGINAEDEDLIRIFKSKYIVIGTNAMLTHIKGLEQILDFLSLNQDYAFIIAGDGKDKDWLEAYSKRLGISERCLFLGFRANAVRYLRYYDIYALPSRTEGFPLALLEAVSNKIPVITSDLKVFAEIFNDNEITRFELDNILSLQQAFDKLNDGKYRSSVVESAYQKYIELYTASAMADRYLSIYNEVLSD
jgi:glycosyltransferase involved in cell wall biosynthesis